MASQTSRQVQRVVVPADDYDLCVNVRQADCVQCSREEIAVERAAGLSRETACQAALALTKGLDRNDCPQTQFRVRWLESNGCTLSFSFRGPNIGAHLRAR